MRAHFFIRLHLQAILLSSLFLSLPAFGTDILVTSKTQFAAAMPIVQPGDNIIWADGTNDNLGTITFEPANWGTAVAPITFRAETPGGVVFRGDTKLLIGGQYLVVSGLRFDNSGFNFSGTSTAGYVIETRAHDELNRHADNCRVTDCAIINYDNPMATSSSKWLEWYGATNRFDHNFVSGKRTQGAVFIVELDDQTNNIEAHHIIDHNVFADRTPDPTGGNEFETVRAGTSTYADEIAHIVVTNNYFYRCSGEAEIVSSKSCENTFSWNTFVSCAGSLSLRHGYGAVVEGNVFFGNNVPNSGGIRMANQDHVIINNYMQDLAGTSYQAALAIMDGTSWTPPATSPDLSGGYVQVKNVMIAHNTIVNAADAVDYGVGKGGSGRNTAPTSSTFAANLIDSSNSPIFTLTDTPSNITNLNNIVWGAATGVAADPNLVVTNPLLAADSMGVYRPAANSPAAGAAGTEFLLPGDLLDMDGALRPLTGRDIGADQIGPGTRPLAPMSITEAGPDWIQSSAPAAVTADPQGLTNAVGSTVLLSVNATGALPLLYQWRLNGTNLSNPQNEFAAASWALVLPNAQTDNSGNYDVVVSNAFGVVTSAVAVVSIYEVTYPPSIATQPLSQTVSEGSNVTFTVSASGTAPLAYQWYFNTNTLLSGQTFTNLVLNNVNTNSAGGYTVVVTNAYGSVTSSVASLTVIPSNSPPTISSQPTNQTVIVGQTANFTVVAAGAAPLSYQWYFNTNTALLDATNATLPINSVQLTNAGGYSVIVTNSFGSVTSAVATLTVNSGSGANSYYWDATTGTPGIQDGTGNWSTTNANWLLNGTGSDVVWDNGGPNDAVFGGGTAGTAGSVTIPTGNTVNVRNLTFNAPYAGSYTITAKTPTNSILNLSSIPAITVANGVSASINAIISGTGFSKEGDGTLTLAGSTGASNLYSGLVTVNGGTLIVQKGSDGIECITAGGIQVNAGSTLQLPKKDQINDAATVTCAGGTINLVSSGGDTFASLVLNGGVVTNSDPGTARTFTLTTAIDVRSGQIAGNASKPIVLAGAAGLTKTTAGTVIMGPFVANTYTGPTVISGGVLNLTNDTAIGANPGAFSASQLTLDGGTLQIAGSYPWGSKRGVTLTANGGTLDIMPAVAQTIPVPIAGTAGGSLTKANTGTLTLTGINTYNGNTTISGGTLALSGNGSIASSTNITLAGGTTLDISALTSSLNLGASQTLTASGTTSAGTIATASGVDLTLTSGSSLQFTAFNGTTAPLAITGAGTVGLDAADAVTVTVANGGTALGQNDYKLISQGASGGITGTAPASVTVNGDGIAAGLSASLVINAGELFLHVAAGTVTPATNSISVSGGTASIGVVGAPSTTYVLQTTTNLLNGWTPIQTNTTDGGGSLNFTDLNATNPQQFYRTVH